MSNSADSVKSRLASVNKTRKITNALYLLSTARLRSELPQAEYRRVYVQRLSAALDTLLCSAEAEKLKSVYLEERPGLPCSILVVTGDKGLCGSYNDDVIECAKEIIENKRNETGIQPLVYGFGKTSEELLKNAGFPVERVFEGSASHPVYSELSALTGQLTDDYTQGRTGELILICNAKARQGKQPEVTRLLPLCGAEKNKTGDTDLSCGVPTVFEPDVNSVFNEVAGSFVRGTVYSLVSLAAIGENGARMDAMKAATDNADEMSEKLEKEMNAQRQLAVTNEITEIAAAMRE